MMAACWLLLLLLAAASCNGDGCVAVLADGMVMEEGACRAMLPSWQQATRA
jgi:hypothetical protein